MTANEDWLLLPVDDERDDVVVFFAGVDIVSVPFEYFVADCERKADARSGIVAVVPLEDISSRLELIDEIGDENGRSSSC